MAINLDNFVQININHAATSKFSGSRNVCTLILFDDNIGEETTYEEYTNGLNEDLENKYSVYLNSFFNNTNNKNCILKIIVRKVPQVIDEQINYITPFLEILNNELLYTDIVVASNLDYDTMKEIRKQYTPQSQIYQKIFLAYKPCQSVLDVVEEKLENFVIKADASAEYDACVAELVSYLGIKLYELIDIYELTSDTTFQEGKTYYVKTGSDPDTYEEAQVVVGDPVPENEYYEITGQNYIVTLDGEMQEGKTYYIEDSESQSGYSEYDKSKQPYEIIATGKTPGFMVDKDGNQYALSLDIKAKIDKPYYSIKNIGSSNITFPYKGIEMTIGAYLTQINVDKYESVKDYCFTKEDITNLEETDFKPIDNNYLAQKLMTNGYNFIGEILAENRNLGGNDSASYSVVNQFMLICLAQELSERLYDLLKEKIKYNITGLNQISTVLVDTLQKYVDNGYLTTDKVWENNDLYYEEKYLIIQKGVPLSMGYKVFICPFSSLSSTDYKNHKLPNIYVLVADNYGIRKIVVDGTTF